LLILLAAIVVPATTETAAGNGADQNILTYNGFRPGDHVMISQLRRNDSEPAVRNGSLAMVSNVGSTQSCPAVFAVDV
jgi:hypothetical protein